MFFWFFHYYTITMSEQTTYNIKFYYLTSGESDCKVVIDGTTYFLPYRKIDSLPANITGVAEIQLNNLNAQALLAQQTLSVRAIGLTNWTNAAAEQDVQSDFAAQIYTWKERGK